MTVKRFKVFKTDMVIGINDNGKSIGNVYAVCDLLNELNDECEFLEIDNEALEDGATKYAELYHKSLKENEQLKAKKFAYLQDIEVYKEENTHLKLENEELKQRNDRQAKRLAELYELMAKKDWESLTEIIDDFCSCEEQLQREWRNLNIQAGLDND